MDRLETARLILRRPKASDLGGYVHYCQSDRSVLVGGPFDRYVFALKANDRPIGHVGALQLDDAASPELSWTIWDSGDEKHGYAFEAGQAYLAHAPRAYGFPSLLARVDRENLPSRKLAERLGGILVPNARAPEWAPNSVTYDFVF
ncbi:GNAT family N-acetyltransferase [Paradevosia shaoguanensis]|uniref:GNAT family N-acetyltransferase n=1 Tax=Paradevosia shaoguanensis TaxID=1335043 RepID=A0AA41UG47_9HYPH|nr:GNAT family N-acetyltransferase [Paradevosia shaoguanensis]MCF1742548.1 GNAT family N-acetyltransferase [Paradevosia shaoguanensis]MCI0127031.1 GNAT family N-acetyltransferase [Paradevosia shaoguanensis]